MISLRCAYRVCICCVYMSCVLTEVLEAISQQLGRRKKHPPMRRSLATSVTADVTYNGVTFALTIKLNMIIRHWFADSYMSLRNNTRAISRATIEKRCSHTERTTPAVNQEERETILPQRRPEHDWLEACRSRAWPATVRSFTAKCAPPLLYSTGPEPGVSRGTYQSLTNGLTRLFPTQRQVKRHLPL